MPLRIAIDNEVKVGLVLVEVGEDDGVEGGLLNAAARRRQAASKRGVADIKNIT